MESSDPRLMLAISNRWLLSASCLPLSRLIAIVHITCWAWVNYAPYKHIIVLYLISAKLLATWSAHVLRSRRLSDRMGVSVLVLFPCHAAWEQDYISMRF